MCKLLPPPRCSQKIRPPLTSRGCLAAFDAMSGTPTHLPKGTIFLLLACTTLFLAIGAENSERPSADFRFHSKPIHPLLIKQFEPWISDARPPITVEVNLT